MSAQRELGLARPKVVYLTKSGGHAGVHIEIGDKSGETGFSPATEAAKLVDALYALPLETRRAFYTLLTQECFDGFNAAPGAPVKTHPWPPPSRIPQ